MENYKQKKFKVILLYSILLIMGIYSVLMFFLIWSNSHDLINNNLKQDSEQILDRATKEIASRFIPLEEKIRYISKSNDFSKYDSSQVVQDMLKFMKHDSTILNGFVYFKQNEENQEFSKCFYFQDDSLIKVNLEEKIGKSQMDDLINLSSANSSIFWKVPSFNEISQRVETVVCQPIFVNQKMIGMVGCNVLLNDFFESFCQGESSQMPFFVLSQEGVLLTDLSETILKGTDLFEYAKDHKNTPLMNVAKLMMNGEKNIMQLIHLENDKNFYFSFSPVKAQHLSVGMYLDKDASFVKVKKMNNYLIVLLIFAMASVLFTVHVLIKKRMNYLNELSSVMKQIGKGVFNMHLSDVETSDEFLTLKDNFHEMQQNLTDYTTKLVESSRKEEQKEQTQIQYQYLKKNILEPDYRKFVFGNSDLLEFKINSYAAKNLSGDFYDYFFIDESKICMVFGNVSGNGITLPLFISFIMNNIRNEMRGKINLVHFVENFNKFLFAHNENLWTIKLLLMIFDSKTKMMNFVNIGYESLYLIRNQMIVSVDAMHGLAIGKVDDAKYTSSTLELQPDDTIVSCSNNVPNLLDKQGVNFGKDRLEQLLNQNKTQYPIPLLQKISNEIELHIKGNFHSNDYSLMAIRIFEKTNI